MESKQENGRRGSACRATRRAVLAAAIAAAAVGFDSGPAHAQATPGVTDGEVRLGGVWALSGPVRFVTEPMEKAIKSVFKDVNDKGGIHGRKIVWTIEDDAYQPARTLAGAKKLVERDQVFALVGIVGAPTTAAVLPYIAQAKVPAVAINGMPPQASRYGFGLQASYADLMYHLTRHLVSKANVKKLGYFFQNDDLGEFGRAGIVRALKELKAEGVLVADAGYERGATDYTTQVLRLRDAGAEAVIAMGTVGSVAAAIKQASAVGYRPTWGTYAIGSSATMQKLVGDQIEGLTFAMETESENSDSPGVRKALQLVRKEFPDLSLDYNAMIGYALAEFTVRALQKAGRDLTRESFIAAAESLGRYDGDVMSVSMSPTKHTGAESFRIFQWKGGKIVPQTDAQPIGGATR